MYSTNVITLSEQSPINLHVHPFLSPICHIHFKKNITGDCQGSVSDLCESPLNMTANSTFPESTDIISMGTYHELIKITLVVT